MASIPDIPTSLDRDTQEVLGAMKEALEVAAGTRNSHIDQWKNKTVTLAQLVRLGIITESQARSL